jgi:hypothetical protein
MALLASWLLCAQVVDYSLSSSFRSLCSTCPKPTEWTRACPSAGPDAPCGQVHHEDRWRRLGQHVTAAPWGGLGVG